MNLHLPVPLQVKEEKKTISAPAQRQPYSESHYFPVPGPPLFLCCGCLNWRLNCSTLRDSVGRLFWKHRLGEASRPVPEVLGYGARGSHWAIRSRVPMCSLKREASIHLARELLLSSRSTLLLITSRRGERRETRKICCAARKKFAAPSFRLMASFERSSLSFSQGETIITRSLSLSRYSGHFVYGHHCYAQWQLAQ